MTFDLPRITHADFNIYLHAWSVSYAIETLVSQRTVVPEHMCREY